MADHRPRGSLTDRYRNGFRAGDRTLAPVRVFHVSFLWLCAGGLLPASSSAQEDGGQGIVQGVVIDAASSTRLAGARVRLSGHPRGTLTDSLGRFALAEVPTGAGVLTVEQYGFEGVAIQVTLTAGLSDLGLVRLSPKPVMLDGITVVADRLEEMRTRLKRRRNAFGGIALAYEQDRLLSSGALDVVDFLQYQTPTWVAPCAAGSISSRCVLRRGRRVEPRVYVDEIPALGGLDELETYRPDELYLVEVYAQGAQIRAYTHRFMERMARRPIELFQGSLWPEWRVR